MEKIAVIGSNSFSGSHFVDYCLSQELSVLGVSRSPEYDPVFLPYKKNENLSSFCFKQHDLNHNLENLIQSLDSFRPDYVVNFAAQGMVAESWLAPDHWYQTNVVANVRFHEQLRKKTYLKKYVHVSTPEVYGSTDGSIKEHRTYNPSTPYAASRAACDLHLWTFYKNYNFPINFTRAANVYGPGQQLYRIIPRTMLFFRTGKTLKLHGGGHSIRSFIHIGDVARATLGIARDSSTGEIYHLSTPLQISIKDLVTKICDQMNVSFDDCVEIADDRPGKDAAYSLDSGKVRGELGWTDEITLEEGLSQTLKWVDTNLDLLRRMPQNYIHKP